MCFKGGLVYKERKGKRRSNLGGRSWLLGKDGKIEAEVGLLWRVGWEGGNDKDQK